MIVPVVIGTVLMAAVAVLQSTVLQFAAIAGVQPDLLLVILVFLANANGTMAGQVAGLAAGIVLDVMGLAPLGFYAMIYTLVGATFGITRGKMFVDPIFMPVVMLVVAVLVKALFAIAIASLFGVPGVTAGVFSTNFLIELGYTAVISPVFFGILRMARPLQIDRRRADV